MFRPIDIRARRPLNVVLVLLLISGLGVLGFAHFLHHWSEAGGHAGCDHGRHHDDGICEIFHAGLLVDAAYRIPAPETPAECLAAEPTLHRPAARPFLAHAPRAPPRAS